MRTHLFLVCLLLLQACSGTGALFSTVGSGDYNPLTLPTADAEKYNKDKQECINKVQTQIDHNMNVNYNIMKFRECLIQKGYVLLSWLSAGKTRGMGLAWNLTVSNHTRYAFARG